MTWIEEVHPVAVLLDVATLPRQALYGPEGRQVDLAEIVTNEHRPTINHMARHGVIAKKESFGFAAAKGTKGVEYLWNKPDQFVWFVAGWGPDQDRYIANAVRKLRAALRLRRDTLSTLIENPEGFRDKVESQNEDGTFPWGDFPWGGGAFVQVGDLTIPCAVSALKQLEDDLVTKLLGGAIGNRMLEIDHLELFA